FFPPWPAAPRSSALSLHDALPIYVFRVNYGPVDHQPLPSLPGTAVSLHMGLHETIRHDDVAVQKNNEGRPGHPHTVVAGHRAALDRKSTRLHSSHVKSPTAFSCSK